MAPFSSRPALVPPSSRRATTSSAARLGRSLARSATRFPQPGFLAQVARCSRGPSRRSPCRLYSPILALARRLVAPVPAPFWRLSCSPLTTRRSPCLTLKSVLSHRRVNVLAVRLTTSEARKMIKNDVAEDPESGIRCSAQLQNPAPLARSRSCVTRSSFAGPTVGKPVERRRRSSKSNQPAQSTDARKRARVCGKTGTGEEKDMQDRG